MQPPPPPKNNHFTVLHCNRLPLAGTSRRVQTGLGLGVQGQGQGQAEPGLGEGECGNYWPFVGRLPDHSSLALLKNLNIRHRPTTTPFRNNKFIKPPPCHEPYWKTIIRRRRYTFGTVFQDPHIQVGCLQFSVFVYSHFLARVPTVLRFLFILTFLLGCLLFSGCVYSHFLATFLWSFRDPHDRVTIGCPCLSSWFAIFSSHQSKEDLASPVDVLQTFSHSTSIAYWCSVEWHTHTHARTHTNNTHMHTHTRTHAHTHAHTHTHAQTDTRLSAFASTHPPWRESRRDKMPSCSDRVNTKPSASNWWGRSWRHTCVKLHAHTHTHTHFQVMGAVVKAHVRQTVRTHTHTQTHTHTHTYTSKQRLQTKASLRLISFSVNEGGHEGTRASNCAHTHIHTHTCANTHTYTCTRTHTRTHTHTHTHTHARTRTHTHTHTHKHTHTHTPAQLRSPGLQCVPISLPALFG